jgi:hypothetical protein
VLLLRPALLSQRQQQPRLHSSGQRRYRHAGPASGMKIARHWRLDPKTSNDCVGQHNQPMPLRHLGRAED